MTHYTMATGVPPLAATLLVALHAAFRFDDLLPPAAGMGRSGGVPFRTEVSSGETGPSRAKMPNFRALQVIGLVTSLGFGSLFGSAVSAHGQSSAYDQPYRPQVHFSPKEHWTNDPNGLVYFH